MITEPAPAKLNLALHVRRRRPDGYHELETIFAFCRDGDLIELEPATDNAFAVAGPFAAALTGSAPAEPWADNLVTRAADAFTAEYRVDRAHRIALTKNLPIASGIGGGSADAAATLRALARLHRVPLDDPGLMTIAAGLGADVPACLRGATTIGRGRGDALEPVAGLPGMPVLLVNPGVPVSTGAVFARWDGVDRGPIGKDDLLTRACAGRNDLQAAARGLAPAIDAVLDLLTSAPGALLARMSGSGATCFALFDRETDRAAAAGAACARGWWCLETALA
ncbi:MAG TPA: 4-(cytidine 5'-diphospho)-2-C-methyl-D-erythritol kinase [Sphingomonas sp.]|jgi:4-diphosphocytidyl-2-C-methyl-D-erythritol kinase|uniref:4-(cytidine 5'-diphospho)-2-C-methyl-D-erythritol kinase n=1 Tax=Sphingomonas sp. TaxID=28214 RepID=UPI002ED838BF